MLDIAENIRQLTSNAEAIRALAQAFSDEHAQWQPDAESWSLNKVIEHLYNEERIDFRKHLKEMLADPPQPWGEFRPEEYVSVENHHRSLDGFLEERRISVAWLTALTSPDWDASAEVPFGPQRDIRIFKAGDVLVSWVAHDFLHMRQMIELLYSWNERRAFPYPVEYAGGW